MKKLGIISYDTGHLKTEQLLFNFIGRYDIRVYGLPFVQRTERDVLFRHRPVQSDGVHPQALCGYLGIPFVPVERDTEIGNGCDYYLVSGAGILSEACVQDKRIINGHPGIIPAVRGLDAFKWSIYDMQPLGVTLHYIDKNIDGGEIISVVPTPVFLSDSMEVLARRHYENEIRIISDFEKHIAEPQNPFQNISGRQSRRRMNIMQEKVLLKRFERYKQQFGGQGAFPPDIEKAVR